MITIFRHIDLEFRALARHVIVSPEAFQEKLALGAYIVGSHGVRALVITHLACSSPFFIIFFQSIHIIQGFPCLFQSTCRLYERDQATRQNSDTFMSRSIARRSIRTTGCFPSHDTKIHLNPTFPSHHLSYKLRVPNVA